MILDLLLSFVRIVVPMTVAAEGELIGERAGILNLGIEGNMLLGAFIGWYFTKSFNNVFIGFISSITAGAMLGAIFWVIIDIMECSHHVTGLGFNFISSGLALTIYRLLPLDFKQPSLPYRGTENTLLIIILCVILLSIIMMEILSRRTRMGLSWDLIGNSLRSADLLGIKIRTYRLGCSIIASAFVFFAGSLLSITVARNFTYGIVSGRGWLALCIVILARWRPILLVPAVSLWAILELLQLNAQAIGIQIPFSILLMLPYVGCIILVFFSKIAKSAPQMLLSTYKRNEDAA